MRFDYVRPFAIKQKIVLSLPVQSVCLTATCSLLYFVLVRSTLSSTVSVDAGAWRSCWGVSLVSPSVFALRIEYGEYGVLVLVPY